ncbi:hypothetical protein OBBRIDRAFT_237948 [Obba rivulosa]|uniref:Uncharacterized protein n=1 Tax=Obba rivulosa TaxID=1052685 RepID=A0A8E2DQE2_9APHY|nr:hypothetical protein OBBRIDRAFT_237948 [Obba rivulosa]
MVSLQQSPWLHVDDTIVPSRVESLPSSYLSSCIGQIKALRELKRAWSNLEVPRLWIDATVSDLDSGLPSDAFNHSYVALCLHHIKEYVRSVDEVNLRSRSPYDLRPNFMLPCHRHEIRPFYSEHRLMDEVTSLGSMSETQLAQFFLHQKDSFGAECAIVTALDGIPSTYVRRRDLKIFTGDGTMSISSLFCALLYTPIAPTTRDSLERFRHLSINVENPAFVLCFEDRARRQEQDTEATESSSLIQEMARTATILDNRLRCTYPAHPTKRLIVLLPLCAFRHTSFPYTLPPWKHQTVPV